ncbi:hypothetical protein NX722_10130 [Endozoicomonas gorgoniicola]|uniref:DUF669 domain-containing protein n=1 Tax=Endozoicomonas gorgoniicola TaxID=1234144 RepID=A0ABT3MUD6_9GAMM|nr:hypothetical protein [Endozoicomonas gorgoniicola]MCW7552991.1 hypothetical protein [Endozoicomonas gorgoniicola]
MTRWNDFNDATDHGSYDVIPSGTLVKVRMTIKPGGFDHAEMGWTGGYATQGDTGAVYLSAEFTVLEGQYAKRKIWSLIGMHSPKGPEWENMGRSFVRGILQSARGIKADDNSPPAYKARQLQSLAELDGIEFLAKVSTEKDQYDDPKNVIKQAITPEHKQYAQLMQGGTAPQTTQQPRPTHSQLQSQLYSPQDSAPHPTDSYNNQWD